MSIRFTAKTRRGMAAVAIAAGLVLSVAGCGGGEEGKDGASSSASKDSESKPDAQQKQPDEVLAELKGGDGLLLTIQSAERDSGGFVTINGQLKNDGAKAITVPSSLSGNETEILQHGRSLGGATLVDSAEKKRYYVLRDTEGRPLTTTGLTRIKSGDSAPIFLQFPAPPETTSEVTFQLPTFAAGKIEISG